MPIVHGTDAFLLDLMNVGEAWLAGRKGSGKSLLAVAIADLLVQRGYVDGCISNMPVALKLPDWRKNMLRNCVIILDESHFFVDNRRSMSFDKGYGGLGRKFNLIWLFPSVFAIDVRLRGLQIQRVRRMSIPGVRALISGLRHIPVVGWLIKRTPIDWFGSEVWVYEYEIDMGKQQASGGFWLVKPEEYYPMFDTAYSSATDGGIMELFQRTMEDDLKNDVGEGTWYAYADELSSEDRALIAAEEGEGEGPPALDFAALATKVRDSARASNGASPS